ncbi:MAG TPA: chromate efflux transporter [Ktedonobacterales bacterium]
MSERNSPPAERDTQPSGIRHAPLMEVVALFLRLGFTAFGGPAAHIAMMRQEIVQRRKWIGDQRFADLLGIVNLIPGPSSTELAIYLGYLRAGWPGLIAAGICFIAPAMLIVLALAWAYVRFGPAPQVGWLLYGIKPVVIAIVAQALYGLSRTILRGPLALVWALALVAAYLLGFNVLILLFGGGLLFGAFRLLERRFRRDSADKPPAASVPAALVGAGAGKATSATLATAGGIASVAVPFSQWALFLTFLKIGAVLYGSGYVLLAFLRDDFVLRLGWLTDRQLLDAISIGQFTPGPVFTTATFVGYLVGGWQGALVATLAIFLPSFLFIGVVHRLADTLRRSPITAPVLDGVNIAALALMAGVTLQLAQSALTDALTVVTALVSLAVLLRFKPNSAWLILAGALVGLAAKTFHLA